MKLLWAKTDFLHPTNRGGQIRTLETIRRLHRRHRVHYVCFADPEHPEGAERAGEYSSEHFTVPHEAPRKNLTSPAFLSSFCQRVDRNVPFSIVVSAR